MQNQILLFKVQDGWMCEFIGSHADEIISSFGTNIIPSAFTANATADYVIAKIKELNQNCDVILK